MEHFEENAWIGTLTEQFVALALFCFRHIFVIGKEPLICFLTSVLKSLRNQLIKCI